MNVHSNFIHNSPNWKKNPRCLWAGDWTNCDHPYNGVQLSNKNEWTTNTYNMDEPQKHYSERKKLDTKEYMLYNYIIWSFKQAKLVSAEKNHNGGQFSQLGFRSKGWLGRDMGGYFLLMEMPYILKGVWVTEMYPSVKIHFWFEYFNIGKFYPLPTFIFFNNNFFQFLLGQLQTFEILAQLLQIKMRSSYTNLFMTYLSGISHCTLSLNLGAQHW